MPLIFFIQTYLNANINVYMQIFPLDLHSNISIQPYLHANINISVIVLGTVDTQIKKIFKERDIHRQIKYTNEKWSIYQLIIGLMQLSSKCTGFFEEFDKQFKIVYEKAQKQRLLYSIDTRIDKVTKARQQILQTLIWGICKLNKSIDAAQ